MDMWYISYSEWSLTRRCFTAVIPLQPSIEENTHMDLKQTGYEWVDRLCVAEDREQWRAVVNMANICSLLYTQQYMYLIIQGRLRWISNRMVHYCFLATCNVKGSLQVSHMQNNFLLWGNYFPNLRSIWNHKEHHLSSKINPISKVQKRIINKLQNKSGYRPKSNTHDS